jgi:saccharopine dehydrogenase-like NADP-dependent oxidoreductase
MAAGVVSIIEGDRFSITGVAVRVEMKGQKENRLANYCSTLIDKDVAIAARRVTGRIAQLMLANQLTKPGVWTPEQILPTNLFKQAMQSRGIVID